MPTADVHPSLRRALRLLRLQPPLARMRPAMSRRVLRASAILLQPWPRQCGSESIHKLADGLRLYATSPRRLAPRAATLLYFHGGGFTIGSAAAFQPFCRLLAATSGTTVYSVDYRLAPEHPFPSPLADAEAAWHWLRARVSGPIVVGGDSAGGNIATVLCRRLRDKGAAGPAAQFLVYPMTSCEQDTASYRQYADGYILTRELMDYFIGHYLGARAADARVRQDPDVAPLRAADLRGLPPAYVALAGHDVLFDEGLAYAERLRDAGVAVEVEIFPDMIHGFANLLALSGPRERAHACARQLAQLITGISGDAPASLPRKDAL